MGKDLDFVRGPLKGTPGYEKWLANFKATMAQKYPQQPQPTTEQVEQQLPEHKQRWASKYRSNLERRGITAEKIKPFLQRSHDEGNRLMVKIGNMERQKMLAQSKGQDTALLSKKLKQMYNVGAQHINRSAALRAAFPEIDVEHKGVQTRARMPRPPEVIQIDE